MRKIFRLLVYATVGLVPAGLFAQPLFDAHLHYSVEDAAGYAPAEILAILDRNGIRRALVSGTPNDHTEALYRHAPERIVPFLGLHPDQDDKISWAGDETLPARVEAALERGIWRGIGELHIFAERRYSPVFRRIVEIAAREGLPLQVHGDPAVIDTLYDIAPQQQVIWAHAGTYPCTELLADYLRRYPALRVDLSVRDGRLAPDGVLAEQWRQLFLDFPERFLVGVDTFSVKRWERFDGVVETMRAWLAQLPPDVARRLAHDNAAELFAADGPSGTPVVHRTRDRRHTPASWRGLPGSGSPPCSRRSPPRHRP